MATTTNYGFEIPDDTDLVKDGALAMRDLGQDVDTQLFTALGGDYPGLRLVKKQTIGTAVTSVTVTNAFSATYENYKVIISGGLASAGVSLAVRLGATITGYNIGQIFINYTSSTVTGFAATNQARWLVGAANTTDLELDVDLKAPFLARKTLMNGQQANGFGLTAFGELTDTTSYTDLVILPTSGNLTGGTIYVYGYGAS